MKTVHKALVMTILLIMIFPGVKTQAMERKAGDRTISPYFIHTYSKLNLLYQALQVFPVLSRI